MIVLGLRRYWWFGAVPLSVWIAHEGFYTYRNNHMPLAPHLQTFMAGSLGAVVFVKIDLWLKKTEFSFRWWHTLLLRVIEEIAIALMLSVSFQGLFFDWIHKGPVAAAPGFGFVSAQMTTIIVASLRCSSGVYYATGARSVLCLSATLLRCGLPADQPPEEVLQPLFRSVCFDLAVSDCELPLPIEYSSQLLAQRISRFLAAQDGKSSGSGLVRFTSLERINMKRKQIQEKWFVYVWPYN